MVEAIRSETPTVKPIHVLKKFLFIFFTSLRINLFCTFILAAEDKTTVKEQLKENEKILKKY